MRLCEDHYTRLIRGISEAKVAWSVSWTLVQIGVCVSGDEEGKGEWTRLPVGSVQIRSQKCFVILYRFDKDQ